MMHEWRLRSSLVFLLVVTALVTSAIVGTAILVIRLPQVEAANRAAVSTEAKELANRVEVLLGAIQARVTLIAELAPELTSSRLQTALDSTVAQGQNFSAVYALDASSRVHAAGLLPAARAHQNEMLGLDLSANRLVRAALEQKHPVWSDKYLSAVTGQVTVGLAVPIGQRVVVAEMPLEYLLHTIRVAAGSGDLSIWVVDRRGEVVVDTGNEEGSGNNALNLLDLPVVQAALGGTKLPAVFTHRGRQFHPSSARSGSIDWVFIARIPAGMDNERILSVVQLVAISFLGTILIGLLLAPAWAARMAKPVTAITERARKIADGDAPGSWPRGAIAEYNQLSADLERMAQALSEREEKFTQIFNASPIAMAVSDPTRGHVIMEVNDAWTRQFGHDRASVVGRSGPDVHLWQDASARERFIKSIQSGIGNMEAWLLHADGTPLLCSLNAKQIDIGDTSMAILTMEDITEKRRNEIELRELNSRLEERVTARTEDLRLANSELSHAVERLQMAQSELVRSEKLAALGSIVAGVAHELNTPIGNGLLAVSSLHNDLDRFRDEVQKGLRRSTLDAFLGSVDTGTDIAIRNLSRAAELVSSFKQVAVDQTSSQRRQFDLAELVREILLTLQPQLKLTPYQFRVSVPAGTQMDSYPGPLGQALSNIISNAVLHAFADRDHGQIEIAAEPRPDDQVNITIRDDGEGIPADFLRRIFDPFVTSKMGLGGTGLGLHITHNAITNVLGGSIQVRSTLGIGTTFEITLPLMAPKAPANDPPAPSV